VTSLPGVTQATQEAKKATEARVILVTGTGTGVGKTVVTAALAARALAAGRRVAVVKPVQTGLQTGEPGDLADVVRLAGPVETHERARLSDPLAPDTAARRAGVDIPSVAEHAAYVTRLARRGDLSVVLVEGAGGLLVRLDREGGDLALLGSELLSAGLDATFVVVALPGLGTLNHSALTAEALERRGLPCAGLVVGSWPQPPDEPDLAMRCNIDDLPLATGLPMIGMVPAGAGSMSRAEFAAGASGWLDGATASGRLLL
jgi:dethiobiotin synthetase